MHRDVNNGHRRSFRQVTTSSHDTCAFGFLETSRRLTRNHTLMEFGHFDPNSESSRHDAHVRIIRRLDLASRLSAKGAPHLFNQSDFFALLDLPSHGIRLPLTIRAEPRRLLRNPRRRLQRARLGSGTATTRIRTVAPLAE